MRETIVEWLNGYIGGNKEGIWNVAVETPTQEDQKGCDVITLRLISTRWLVKMEQDGSSSGLVQWQDLALVKYNL